VLALTAWVTLAPTSAVSRPKFAPVTLAVVPGTAVMAAFKVWAASRNSWAQPRRISGVIVP